MQAAQPHVASSHKMEYLRMRCREMVCEKIERGIEK